MTPSEILYVINSLPERKPKVKNKKLTEAQPENILIYDKNKNRLKNITLQKASFLVRHKVAEIDLEHAERSQAAINLLVDSTNIPELLKSLLTKVDDKKNYNFTYENINFQDQNGNLIFRNHSKRALWYLSRGLSKLICCNPPTYQLLFETNGLGRFGDNYYLEPQKNVCVVCNSKEELTRHHVVPSCFRMHLPDVIKSYESHDVLPVCNPCHRKYESLAHTLQQQLLVDTGLKSHCSQELRDVRYILGLCRMIRDGKIKNTKLRGSGNIPASRFEFFRNKIRELVGRDLTEDEIKRFSHKTAGRDHNSAELERFSKAMYYKKVVDRYENPLDLVYLWRNHFIDTMNPQFLPEQWDAYRIAKGYKIEKEN